MTGAFCAGRGLTSYPTEGIAGPTRPSHRQQSLSETGHPELNQWLAGYSGCVCGLRYTGRSTRGPTPMFFRWSWVHKMLPISSHILYSFIFCWTFINVYCTEFFSFFFIHACLLRDNEYTRILSRTHLQVKDKLKLK